MTHRETEFEEFLITRGDELFTFAVHLVSDYSKAQDLLQDSLIRLYLKWRVVRPETRVGYVKRILVRESINTWRRRRWREQDPLGVEPLISEADFTVRADENALLLRALANLPNKQRTALVLRYLHDSSVSETAKLMGVPPNTVKTLCARALENLRADQALTFEFSEERRHV